MLFWGDAAVHVRELGWGCVRVWTCARLPRPRDQHTSEIFSSLLPAALTGGRGSVRVIKWWRLGAPCTEREGDDPNARWTTRRPDPKLVYSRQKKREIQGPTSDNAGAVSAAEWLLFRHRDAFEK